MSKPGYFAIALILVVLVSAGMGTFGASAAHPTVNLLTASNFAVLAGADVNDSNPSAVTGDVGLSPATGAQIDIPCTEVTGTIYDVDGAYTGGGDDACLVTNSGLLTTAKNDLTTAYNDAAGRPASTIGTELAGATLLDGTYVSDAGTFEIAASGTLTLDAQGVGTSVFIFQMESTLTTFANSQVVLVNGAQACNVFWQVGSSAVLGTGTNFVGTIMADQSITDNGGSTVEGRFLARIAAVTLDNTTIIRPLCAEATSTATNTATTTATNTPGGGESTNTPVPPATNTLVPVPAATATATAPAVVGLPQTGGAPLQSKDSAWVLMLVGGGLGALAVGLGLRAYRRRAR